MLMKGITLKGIEVFETLAKSGSVAKTASLTGLSQPAVSQQLRNLETALGAELVDHKKRPMQLTPAGSLFLNRVELALGELRAAQSELTIMDLAHISVLNIGIIDDFDDKITPRLATILADSLSDCRLKVVTASSFELANDIASKKLHLAISASTGKSVEGLVEYPIARDPFMIVAPRDHNVLPEQLLTQGDLPFLRYEKEQLISKQIESALDGIGASPPERFEIGSHLALMSMVARGLGWAITTPLGYMRAHRFKEQVSVVPWPHVPFSRQISLFANSEWADEVPMGVARTMRRLVQSHMIDPLHAELPFLEGALCTIDPETAISDVEKTSSD